MPGKGKAKTRIDADVERGVPDSVQKDSQSRPHSVFSDFTVVTYVTASTRMATIRIGIS